MSSNRLVDILDDDEKLNNLNKDYHYRQSVFPRLEKLRKLIWNQMHLPLQGQKYLDEQDKDLNFVQDLKSYLNTTPHRRITKSEMKECNKLWNKYK
jgi:hypothetical protein